MISPTIDRGPNEEEDEEDEGLLCHVQDEADAEEEEEETEYDDDDDDDDADDQVAYGDWTGFCDGDGELEYAELCCLRGAEEEDLEKDGPRPKSNSWLLKEDAAFCAFSDLLRGFIAIHGSRRKRKRRGMERKWKYVCMTEI